MQGGGGGGGTGVIALRGVDGKLVVTKQYNNSTIMQTIL